MDKHIKIIDLLDKDFLTEDEQNYLNEVIHSDEDSASLVAIYNNLKTNLPNTTHLDTELLGEFILYEKNELGDDRIIPLLAAKMKSHLKNCLVCDEEYQKLIKEYEKVGVHLKETIKKKVTQNSIKPKISTIIVEKFSTFRYVYATVAVLAVLYLGLFTISSISTPDYTKNIFSDDDNGLYMTRGRTSVLFQKGLDAADRGHYDEALNYFEEDIIEHSSESSIFYSHFITGLIYLKSAEKDFLGLFLSYDVEKINHAIENLNTSIEKNTSGNYDNLKLDAHYYLGRSYLLLENYDKAKEELNIVITLKGKFYNQAKELVSLPEMN